MRGKTSSCAEQISTETLSAWRDRLLPGDQMVRIEEHTPRCVTCQGHMADFEQVARALRRQRELEPGNRILEGLQMRVEQTGQEHMSTTRRRTLAGGGPLAAALAVAVLLGIVLRGLRESNTTLPPASDAAITSQLTYAFVQGNEVWVSLHGTPPRQVTHLGVTRDYSFWNLFWADDA